MHIAEFEEANAKDRNAWWRLSSGEHQNLFEEACERYEGAVAHLAAKDAEIERLNGQLAAFRDALVVKHLAFVPGKIVPWRMGTVGKGGGVYGLETLKAYQQKIRTMTGAALKAIDGAVRLQFDFVCPRPKRPKYWYPMDFDTTNAQKSTEDALQGLVFKNDRHVIEIASRKRYPVGDEATGVHIHVSRITEPKARGRRKGKVKNEE